MDYDHIMTFLSRREKRLESEYIREDDSGRILASDVEKAKHARIKYQIRHEEEEILENNKELGLIEEKFTIESVFPKPKYTEIWRDDGKVFYISDNERALYKLGNKTRYNMHFKDFRPNFFLTMTVKPEKYSHILAISEYVREFMNRLKTYIRWKNHEQSTQEHFRQWLNKEENVSYVWVSERGSDPKYGLRIHAHFLLQLPQIFIDELKTRIHIKKRKNKIRHFIEYTNEHLDSYLEPIGIYQMTKIESPAHAQWYCTNYITKKLDCSKYLGRKSGTSRNLVQIPENKKIVYHEQNHKYSLQDKETHSYLTLIVSPITYAGKDYATVIDPITHQSEITLYNPPEKYKKYIESIPYKIKRLRILINQGEKTLKARKG